MSKSGTQRFLNLSDDTTQPDRKKRGRNRVKQKKKNDLFNELSCDICDAPGQPDGYGSVFCKKHSAL